MPTAESIVDTTLAQIAGGRIYPDVAPAGAPRPHVVYQSVGGPDETTLDGLNELRNSRMQLVVWADGRPEAGAVMEQILQALTAAPVRGTPIGSPVSVHEDNTKLYGSRLDISIWYTV